MPTSGAATAPSMRFSAHTGPIAGWGQSGTNQRQSLLSAAHPAARRAIFTTFADTNTMAQYVLPKHLHAFGVLRSLHSPRAL